MVPRVTEESRKADIEKLRHGDDGPQPLVVGYIAGFISAVIFVVLLAAGQRIFLEIGKAIGCIS